MDKNSNVVMIDAHTKPVDVNEILPKQTENIQLCSVLDDMTVEDYKSIFFLLMDHVGEVEFINLIKKEKVYLRQKLDKILNKNDLLLIELLGTMKMYKKIKTLNACHHVFEKFQQIKFNNINEIWKLLYSLCEEMSDDCLNVLKQLFPDKINEIETAEEWFFWALQKKIISKTDFSSLHFLFKKFPNCMAIIRNFERPQSYDIRTPTAAIDCGIAVILNFETFNDKFPKRDGSDIDVMCLKEVFNLFGFKIRIHNNLTSEQTLACLKFYADLDHSNYDAFICCILSHGRSNSVITSDGKEVPIPFFIAQITNCKSLNLKPKLFFIQACQGTFIPQGFGQEVYQLVSVDEPESVAITLTRPPLTSDVLLAVSSIDGYVSFRHKTTGSWFIQALYQVMKQKGDKFSILDVMIEVNSLVRKQSFDLGACGPRSAKQIVNCQNTFQKIFILKRRT